MRYCGNINDIDRNIVVLTAAATDNMSTRVRSHYSSIYPITELAPLEVQLEGEALDPGAWDGDERSASHERLVQEEELVGVPGVGRLAAH